MSPNRSPTASRSRSIRCRRPPIRRRRCSPTRRTSLFNSTIRYDASFFTSLDRIVQSEPWLPRDRAMIDPLRSLGIEKGKPFNPRRQDQGRAGDGNPRGAGWLEARYDARSSALLRRQPVDGPGRPGTSGRGASRLHRSRQVSGRCPRPDLFLCVHRHQAPRCRPVLSDQHQGQGRQAVRRRQDLSSHGAGEPAGRAILVGDGVRPRNACADPQHAAGQPLLADSRDAEERGRFGRRLFRPGRSRGKETNWVPTDPKRGFEVDVPRLRADQGVLREDVEAVGHRDA